MAIANCYFFSPVDFAYAGVGTYDDSDSLPDNSTNISPGNIVTQHTYVFTDGAWVSTLDMRRVRTYSTTDGSMGESITDIGQDVPDGFTSIAPPDFPLANPTAYTFTDGAWVLDQDKQDAAVTIVVNAQRSQLLRDSDHYEGIGSMIDTSVLEDISKYRQWLRDIPGQQGFPNSIIWPTLPDIIKADALANIDDKQTAISEGVAYAIANPLTNG